MLLTSEVDACLNTTNCKGYVSTPIASTSYILIGVDNGASTTVYILNVDGNINRNWGFRGDNSLRNLLYIASLNIVITSPTLRSRSYTDGSGDITSSYSAGNYIRLLDYDSSLGLIGYDSNNDKVIKFDPVGLGFITEFNSLRGFNFVAMKILGGTNFLILCTSSTCMVGNVILNTLYPATIDQMSIIDYALIVDPPRKRFALLDVGNGGQYLIYYLNTANLTIDQVDSGYPLQNLTFSYSGNSGGSICMSEDAQHMFTGIKNSANLFSLAQCVQPCLTCDTNNPAICLQCPDPNYILLNGACVLSQLNCDQSCSTCFGPSDSNCLTCGPSKVWNSSTYTCRYPCPNNCRDCQGLFTNDCVECEIGYAVVNGACSACKENCLICSFEGSYECHTCKSATSVLSDQECVLCANEDDFIKNQKICEEGDEKTVFIDWNFKAIPARKTDLDEALSVNLSVILINSTLSISANDVARLFSAKLERKDISLTSFNNMMIIKVHNPLKGQDLVQIEMTLGDEGNLLRESNQTFYRLVNRSRKVMYGAMNETILGNVDVSETSKPMAAMLQAASILSLSSTFCQTNVGGSLMSLIQIIEIYGKLFFTPSYFSPLMNISLNIIEKVGNGLEISDSWLKGARNPSKTRYFFKLTEYKMKPFILSSIPVQVILYSVQ